MKKLSKIESRNHLQALDLLNKPKLNDDDKSYIFKHYYESATNFNSLAGAFFTPEALAWEVMLDIGNIPYKNQLKVIDLCAGIGVLSHCLLLRYPNTKVTCIEINPEYVEVGQQLVPDAEWICANVADINAMQKLGHFDLAVANPPFGHISTFKNPKSYRYTGKHAEYCVIDMASLMARFGVFIVPQESAGFKFSGVQSYEVYQTEKYKKFIYDTGLSLDINIGIDTSCEEYNDWKGVNPTVEIVSVDFLELSIPIMKTANLL